MYISMTPWGVPGTGYNEFSLAAREDPSLLRLVAKLRVERRGRPSTLARRYSRRATPGVFLESSVSGGVAENNPWDATQRPLRCCNIREQQNGHLSTPERSQTIKLLADHSMLISVPVVFIRLLTPRTSGLSRVSNPAVTHLPSGRCCEREDYSLLQSSSGGTLIGVVQ